ncbi:MAG: putative quinol monooxygenase [Caldimonas sp.]
MSKPNLATRRLLIQGAALGSGLIGWHAASAASSKKSGELYVIAEIVAKPDKADALRALIVPFAAKSRKEPGCREYTLMEVESEPGRFLTYERWTSRAALDAHMKTPDMAAMAPKLGDLLAKPFTQIFLRAPKAK